MKSLGQRLERIFAAIAFAETGEYEKAGEILKETGAGADIKTDSLAHSLMPLTVKGN